VFETMKYENLSLH